jgi:SNF2 family DNA or RNA helicase
MKETLVNDQNTRITADAEFAVAITEHRVLGYLFFPYLIKPNDRGSFYTIKSMVFKQDVLDEGASFTKAERELVSLIDEFSDEKLTRRFSRLNNSKDFYQNLDKEYFNKQILPYIDKKMAACVELMAANQIRLFLKPDKYSNFYIEDLVEILPEEAETVFHFNLKPDSFSYQLHVEYEEKPVKILNRKPIFLVNDPCFMVLDHKLFRFRNLSAKKLGPFLQKEHLSIPLSAIDKYMNSFVLNAIRGNTVEAKGFEIVPVQSEKTALITLEEGLDLEPMLTLKFIYGKKSFMAGRKGDVLVELQEGNGQYVFYKHARDMAWEKSLIAFLESLGVKLSASQLVLSKELNPFGDRLRYLTINWLNRNSQVLQDMGIVVEQQMDLAKYFLGLQNIEFKVKDGTDWFDLFMMVRFGDFEIPFYRLKEHILNNRREFELPNGETAILPLEWFSKYSSLLTYARHTKNGMQLSRHHFALLLEHEQELNQETLESLRRFELKNFEQLDEPDGFRARMRPYQAEGYSWLHYLGQNNFGACLADDMGLGKTIQTLALLQKNKNLHKVSHQKVFKDGMIQASLFPEETNGLPASLIVLPTSLVHNWWNEIKKFAPLMKAAIYTGTSRKKNEIANEMLDRYDLILTSYGVVRNDIEVLKDIAFNYVILDESQNIKNPESKTFQAVCELNARARMVLTGTPVENSLSDLWAQFHFLNPGLLGNHHFFRSRYLIPIEKEGNEEQQKELQKLIGPFILRRTKEEVAQDLPPLTEQLVYCVMEESQRELYENTKSAIRNNLLISMEGTLRDRWAFLAIQAMTRLRQLANHPLLVGEKEAGSGKFEEVMGFLHSLMSENHKVLIFSSFVKHLKVFESEFVRLGWGFNILTGITHDRKKEIDEFQTDPEKKIFLISLKAGGVGLNLTAADYIFILDPWWNPAAEDQAVSRAHRIGQDKKVFVYRFITQGSIEEKMLVLKSKKMDLADRFVNSNNPLKAINNQELLELFN